MGHPRRPGCRGESLVRGEQAPGSSQTPSGWQESKHRMGHDGSENPIALLVRYLARWICKNRSGINMETRSRCNKILTISVVAIVESEDYNTYVDCVEK